MLIREFKENDRPALRDIYLQSRIDTFQWLDTSAYALFDFDEETIDESILIAEKNNEIIGFASLWRPDNFIHLLFIRHNQKSKGVGKQLLNACVAALQSPVRLKCMENNVDALMFYLSQGWKIEEQGEDEHGRYFQLMNL